ncbi:MAG: DUF6338 family protein [Thermoleophilaceae bacterium]
MIGTIEALGVFLLAVLPGFVGLRLYGLGRPPLRARSALHEIAVAIMWSLVGWIALFAWKGSDLLATVLEVRNGIDQRLDAFAELLFLAVAIGVALAVVARVAVWHVHAYATRDDASSLVAQSREHGPWRASGQRVRRWWSRRLHHSVVPSGAWDRLLAQLESGRQAVLCRVVTCDGREVLGVLAGEGYADWEADGRDLLLMPEVIRLPSGDLQALQTSRGVFVPGSQIATVSVVRPSHGLDLDMHG